MFVDRIDYYRDFTGDRYFTNPEYGYWLESDGDAHRYALSPEESVKVRFDDNDEAWEVDPSEEDAWS
jgi:hypothetical protein